MTNNKVTFEFFDTNINSMQQRNIKHFPSPISTDFGESSSTSSYSTLNSPTLNQTRLTNSSSSTTSLNSLFDNAPPYLRSTSTTTITPVLSRNDSNSFKFNFNLTQQQPLHPTIQELEFTKTIDSKLLKHSQDQQQEQQEKLVVILVGLPASGKSTVCKQLDHFINTTTSFKSKIYNAGDVRRTRIKRKSCTEFNDANFFDPNNQQGKKDRELYATITVNNLIHDLNLNLIDVGFLDATNTTIERRSRMINLLNENLPNSKIIIFDVQCNDDKLLNYNISCKSNNNDYKDKDYIMAINDFKQRSMNYKKIYQPITNKELENYNDKIQMYIKCINAGEIFEFNIINQEFIHKEEENDEYPWFDILNKFKNNYYELEGKKYLEKVNNWYNMD